MNQHTSNSSSKEIGETDKKSSLASEMLSQPVEKQDLESVKPVESVKPEDTYVSGVDLNNAEPNNAEPNNSYLNDVDFTEAKLIGKISSCF